MPNSRAIDRRNLSVAVAVVFGAALSHGTAFAVDKASPLARIKSPNASLHDKATAFEELALDGGPESIAALGERLSDPRLSHYARYALQASPDPAAGEALRGALDKVRGAQLIGVINSLASRRDVAAVDALTGLCGSEDPAVALAAAGALAAIGSDAALAALAETPVEKATAFTDALLQGALAHEAKGDAAKAEALLNRLAGADAPVHVMQAVELALVRNATPEKAEARLAELLASPVDWRFVVGLQAAVQAGPDRYSQTLASAIDKNPPGRQVRILSVIEGKPGTGGLAAARAASRSPHPEVRLAAVAALGALGNKSDGPLLFRLALSDPAAREPATQALLRIKDPQLDSYLAGMLDGAEPSKRALAAELSGRRGARSATPKLLALTRGSDSAEVRLAALGALRRVAPGDTLGKVFDLVASAPSTEEARLAKLAAVEVAQRVADPSAATAAVAERLEHWPPADHGVLLDALARVGDNAALELVAQAAFRPDRATQDAATRVLGAWPNGGAAPALLRVAGSGHAFSVRALRGYLRAARQYSSGQERIAMCRLALGVADRDEERLLALDTLALTPSAESLKLATAQLTSDVLASKAEAVEPVLKIAEAVSPTNPAEAAAAARAVLAISDDKQLVDRARKLAQP